MLNIKKHINGHYLILFLLCMVNLLFMHYQFLLTINLEINCYISSIIDNFIACLLDVTVLLVFFWLITLRRLRLSLTLTFFVTLIWSFCNVLYSRFFLQYLSWSSIGQAGNLTEGIVIDSMWEGFRIIDLYYPIAACLFCWLSDRYKNRLTTKSLRTALYLWAATFCIGLATHSMYFFHPTTGFMKELRMTVFTSTIMDTMWSNWAIFHKGFIRKLFISQLTQSGKLELSNEQKTYIKKEYTDHHQRVTGRTAPGNVKNVIFILIESYLACTSDLVVDGQEITPNLNRLRHDSATYYNGHVQPNISLGESSDGQLIYMAGLLPLHSEITVSKARTINLLGLPKQLKKIYPDLQSYTLIPTSPTFWHQQEMTKGYGFDHLYSSIEYHLDFKDNKTDPFINDDMVFQYATQLDKSMKQPFCSLILTMDMHMPYTSQIEHGFHLTDKNLPEKYKNYLVNCHYTDLQIGKYMDELKKNGLYDNSLIIIASDHDAHPTYLDMEGKITREIPIYIINGGIDNSKAWDGACNQLDIYTTILDVMGIESPWHGLGHTLLQKGYQNSVTDKVQELSDWIIYSDYFGKEKK